MSNSLAALNGNEHEDIIFDDLDDSIEGEQDKHSEKTLDNLLKIGTVISEAMYQKLIEVTDEMEISASNFIRDAIQEKITKCKGED